jgi:hypothetical protein
LLLREVGVSPEVSAERAEDAAAATERATLDPAQFPMVTSLGAELSRADPDTDFEFGLDLLVHAIAALLPAASAG